jgi:ABC-type transporter Mla subunit MlaD
MTEELFRWVVAAGVGLACLAMLVQAIVLLKLHGAVQKVIKEQTEPLLAKIEPVLHKIEPMMDRVGAVLDKVGPLIEKAGPAIQQAGPLLESIESVANKAGNLVLSVNLLVDDTRPKVAEISDEAVAIVKTGRDQVERIGELLQDAAGRARVRLDQIDRSLDSTVHQVEQVTDSVKRAVMRPVREVNGVAAGISAAVSALGRRKSPVDAATQDEEMFI